MSIVAIFQKLMAITKSIIYSSLLCAVSLNSLTHLLETANVDWRRSVAVSGQESISSSSLVSSTCLRTPYMDIDGERLLNLPAVACQSVATPVHAQRPRNDQQSSLIIHILFPLITYDQMPQTGAQRNCVKKMMCAD